MEEITLEFSDTGGYDCMTGAWKICKGYQVIAIVDQSDFGQIHCDYDFRSEEAERIAKRLFECLTAQED